MRVVTVFYSFSGNTRFVATQLEVELGAQPVPLSVTRPRRADVAETYTWRRQQVRLPENLSVAPADRDALDAADLIIIGAPVWGGTIAPPVRAFLQEREFFRRSFALYCCYSGRCGAALHDLRDLLVGNDVVSELSLRDPLADERGAVEERVHNWANTLFEWFERDTRGEAAGE